MTECPTVSRLVEGALEALDTDTLREAVLRYTPSEETRQRIAAELMDECGITQEQADIIAGMSDEVIAALRRRLEN